MDREIDENSMQNEANRLASFVNWPASAPVQPTQLARAGFYYTGTGDEVKCFKCKGRVLCWDAGDTPLEEHRKHFPTCPFLTDPDSSDNVPLVAGPLFTPTTVESSAPDSSAGSTNVGNGDLPVPDSAMRRPPDPLPRVNAQFRNLSMNYTPAVASTGISGGVFGAKQSLVNVPHVPIPFNREEMRHEQKRLDTLRNWPKSHLVDIRDVARTGLFFVGPGDKVKCAFCNGAMMNWDAGDNPQEEHFKYFGDRCPLARGEPTDNVPIDGSQVTGASTFELLNIVTERPRYPDFAVIAVRQSSFRNWPRQATQNPERLAEAGFYYTGTSDQVRCFFCGGGLKNWDERDDPWKEHAKWFHQCGYVRQMKGQDFIHQVKRAQALVESSEAPNQRDRKVPPDEFDRRRLNAAMTLPQTLMVLEMGFSRELVERVIENRLRATGENFANASELAEVVMLQQHQGNESQSSAAVSVPVSQPAPVVAVPTTAAAEPPASRGASGEVPMDEDSSLESRKEPSAQATGGGESGETKTKKKKKKKNKKKKGQKGKEDKEEEMEAETGEEQSMDEEHVAGIHTEQLMRENEQLREQKLCKICMDKDCNIVFLPCGHMVACEECAGRLKKCPICNAIIRGTVKAYMA